MMDEDDDKEGNDGNEEDNDKGKDNDKEGNMMIKK